MKKSILLVISSLLLIFQSCNRKRTELIMLGTVHQPVENFNSDDLYNILVKLKPDLILFEVDSSFFTQEFKFNKTWSSNENIATVKYINNHKVDVRPYDFTGRNEYRIKIGSRPTDRKTTKLLDSLYIKGDLNVKETLIYEEFHEINDSLNSFAVLGPKSFNNNTTDSIAKVRQHYQYEKLMEIIKGRKVFSNTFHIKADGDSISYMEGYKRAGEFWHLRNKTMAKNILHFTKEYKGKRIVVLNGYFHRYYLNSLLKPKQEESGFTIKNFDEY